MYKVGSLSAFDRKTLSFLPLTSQLPQLSNIQAVMQYQPWNRQDSNYTNTCDRTHAPSHATMTRKYRAAPGNHVVAGFGPLGQPTHQMKAADDPYEPGNVVSEPANPPDKDHHLDCNATFGLSLSHVNVADDFHDLAEIIKDMDSTSKSEILSIFKRAAVVASDEIHKPPTGRGPHIGHAEISAMISNQQRLEANTADIHEKLDRLRKELHSEAITTDKKIARLKNAVTQKAYLNDQSLKRFNPGLRASERTRQPGKMSSMKAYLPPFLTRPSSPYDSDEESMRTASSSTTARIRSRRARSPTQIDRRSRMWYDESMTDSSSWERNSTPRQRDSKSKRRSSWNSMDWSRSEKVLTPLEGDGVSPTWNAGPTVVGNRWKHNRGPVGSDRGSCMWCGDSKIDGGSSERFVTPDGSDSESTEALAGTSADLRRLDID